MSQPHKTSDASTAGKVLVCGLAPAKGSARCAWCGENPHELRRCPAAQDVDNTRRELLRVRSFLRKQREPHSYGSNELLRSATRASAQPTFQNVQPSRARNPAARTSRPCSCAVVVGSALRVLWWKVRDTYHCRRKLGISWRFAWEHAEAHVEQGWHLEMTPKEAAQEEAYAWAASC